MNFKKQFREELIKEDAWISLTNEQRESVVNTAEQQLQLYLVSNCKRDETLELLEEIMIKVKEADSEVGNGIYDPMLECAKHILNNYKIERR